MRIIKSPKYMSLLSRRLRKAGKRVGLVPTMGCLHEGHLSLMRAARRENDVVVISIFVNPAQFGPGEDYKRYPRDIRRDARLALSESCDILFHPGVDQVYPEEQLSYVVVEGLSSTMCGVSRPAHFKGVATVCAKLFNIIVPDKAYFGQKDYQQALIIKKMAKDLNMGLRIKVLPIVREKSGLAMSSRNEYLTPGQRHDAAVLYAALKEARRMIRSGEKSIEKIKSKMRRLILEKRGFKIDYITVADTQTLREPRKADQRVIVALAVYAGKVRLIDNIMV